VAEGKHKYALTDQTEKGTHRTAFFQIAQKVIANNKNAKLAERPVEPLG
jgi:hypothetical protein